MTFSVKLAYLRTVSELVQLNQNTVNMDVIVKVQNRQLVLNYSHKYARYQSRQSVTVINRHNHIRYVRQ